MNKATEEKRRHTSEIRPYSHYECMIPDYFAQVPLHWHSEFEINYILEGSSEFVCGSEKFAVQQGDVVIILPNVMHAIYPGGDNFQRYDTIVFSPQLLGAYDNDRCAAECIRPLLNESCCINAHIAASYEYYGEIKAAAESIFSCARQNSPLTDMLLKSQLLRLFWLLYDSGSVRRAENPPAAGSEPLRPVLEYIAEHFREELSIQQLAEYSHFSKSYFMAEFKSFAGIGAAEYINQLRIKAACEILRTGEKAIAETAYECGFRNLSNFNRQFRRIVGCTPSEYRRLNSA